ncbi:MAG: DUF2796 domain-containing protein [Candidatus Thiodiazotropha sp. (ex Lucinoma borealis)]|nr:DUF2796 domain-containing protein [Candidatus Thiodiazotropha sp. (ex Lucinoma borealis)]MCU7857775.1 DUF2796 domain-containing protein [Candidatus Thiodiazotropha sp. (ex Lucinoma borealis)]MCU7869437.1 DUF2796 domain-containing protein [Candidatus Thiodiazotropha sp. (ex Lucinoma borealis)]
MHCVKQGLRLSILSLLTFAQQSTGGEHDREQHGVHVHGEAQLFVAQEGNVLEIELLSPAMNIVGFEHQPSSKVQTQAVETAIATLKQPTRLFNLPSAAGCSVESAEAASPQAVHDHHEHDHQDHKHQDETHSDFTGHYRFECSAITQLEVIRIDLFKHFPGIERIEAQTVSNRGQHKIDLAPDQNTLKF